MEGNGNGQQAEEFQLPEWVATLIGRLQIENEALRRVVGSMQMQQPQSPAEVEAS